MRLAATRSSISLGSAGPADDGVAAACRASAPAETMRAAASTATHPHTKPRVALVIGQALQKCADGIRLGDGLPDVANTRVDLFDSRPLPHVLVLDNRGDGV